MRLIHVLGGPDGDESLNWSLKKSNINNIKIH